MAEKKYCTPKQGWCINEKALIALIFAAIIIISVGVSYAVTTEKNKPGYNTGPLKLFLLSLDKYTIAITLLIGITILFIAIKAYRKTQSSKFFFIMLAFTLFAFEWLLKLIDRYYIPGELLIDPIENLIELGTIIFLAIGIFRK